MKARITVVGTYAVGVSIRTNRIPSVGETLAGDGLSIGFGGKGSNQAIAAARLGTRVELVTGIGTDPFGDEAVKLFRREGVGIRGVFRSGVAPTGVGAILVLPDGNNAIVVDIGANRVMDRDFVVHRSTQIRDCSALITVTEAPVEAVCAAVDVAFDAGVPVFLNPAPAVELPQETFRKVFAITPNRSELAVLTGRDVGSDRSVEQAARELIRLGVHAVVVTLGEGGALAVTGEQAILVPTPRVEVVDTTGAGDAFTAALTVFCSEGESLEHAVRYAVCSGSLACTRREVVPSLPGRGAVITLYNSTDW